MHLREHSEKDLKCIEDCILHENLEQKIDKDNIVFEWVKEGIICLEKNGDAYFAIASDDNEYVGTVRLYNINESNAELEIFVRNAFYGKGYAWFALEETLSRIFNNMGLESVYWKVKKDNHRAIRFCEKHNFREAGEIPNISLHEEYSIDDYIWFSVLKGDELEVRSEIVGCKVIRINTIPTVDAGELSFFEANRDINFDIKRIYYISKVPEGIRRGFHAHKKLKQLLFCPHGRIQLILENENGREEIELSDPSIGVLIDKPTWREMLWLQKDSVLCVAASDFYTTEDYIRDYDAYKAYISEKINDRDNKIYKR